MSRLRMAAAILAGVAALTAGLFFLNDGVGQEVTASAAFATLCLAVVLPFRADGPPGRKRILAASIAFVVAAAAGLALAWRTDAGIGPMGVLAGLIAAGAALAVWAFRTRNRRRRSMWDDYYDA